MNRSEMRRCGKRYGTLDAAQRSKAGLLEGAVSSACPFGCGGFHVRKPPAAPGPARADRQRSPRGSVKAAVRLVLGGNLTVAEASAVTGANPESVEAAAWAAAKHLALERDSYTCLYSGQAAVDVHHRVRRGMGGTADPVIAFGLANLVSLSRASHNLAHEADKPEMAVKGYRLETWQDPAAEPLTLFSEGGFGSMVWLTPDGSYGTESPARAA